MTLDRKPLSKSLDVLELSEEVERDSLSGSLSRAWVNEGQTLYGINPQHPSYLERITPDGNKVLGHWHNGEFIEETCFEGKPKGL